MNAHVRLPVLSCAEAVAVENAYIGKDVKLGWVLMQRAAQAITDEALACLGRKPLSILVLVGSGKNGADALLAAQLAAQRSTSITAVFADTTPSSGLPLKAWLKVKNKTRVVRADIFTVYPKVLSNF